MYSIYTTMYGPMISEKLNADMQHSELSELFPQTKLLDNFCCDIPYSGDGLADMHIGVILDSSESRSKKIISEPTEKQKKIYKKGINILIKYFKQALKETQELHCIYDEDEMNIANEFLEALQQDPEVYRAYSTS